MFLYYLFKKARQKRVILILFILWLFLMIKFIFHNCVTSTKQPEPHNFNPLNTTGIGTDLVKIDLWLQKDKPISISIRKRIANTLQELNQESGNFCRNQYGDETWGNLNCQFFTSPELVGEADAVSFSMFNTGFKMSNLPKIRKLNQLWISALREAPTSSYWANPLQNLINWTMSYRSDSEIWSPYGRKVKLKTPLQLNKPIMIGNISLDEWIKGKTKFVVGAISHCHTPSKREELVAKMNQSSGQVDIFGNCGNVKSGCSLRENYNKKCDNFWETVASQYKFYLAFENALCTDYITEKFWRTLEVGMVPVVYGGGNYVSDAPPGSFINARDFKSVGELMAFLKKVGNNGELYSKYFEWRREYTTEQEISHGYCSMCKAVWDHKTGKNRIDKVYKNLKDWWHHQPGSSLSACEKAQKFTD